MLIGSECELTLALGYEDSSHKVLSETMLKQEEIFRNQVFELHRLYQTQKTLMKELVMEVGYGENSHPFVGPFSKHSTCEYMPTDMKLGEHRRSMSNHCLPEHRGTSKHQLRPLDLQLSASHCITNDEVLLLKNYDCVASRISSKMSYEDCGDNLLSMEDLELSLRADSHTYKRQSSKDKDTCSLSSQAVCLQEPSAGNFISQPAVGYSIQVSTKSGKDDAFGRILESFTLTNGGQELEEKKYCNQGIKQHHGSFGDKISSAKRKLFACHEVGQLDLNKPIPDESFDHSIEHWIPSSSKVSSVDISHDGGGEYGDNTSLNVHCWKRPKNNSSNEPSMLDQKDAANSSSTTSPIKSTGEQLCGSVLTSINLGSNCGSPSESRDRVGCSGNFKPEKNCQMITSSKVHDKRNKEENLHSSHLSEELLEATDSNKSPVSCKSWITDDESSNTKTEKCGTEMSNSHHLSLVQQNAEPSVGITAQAPDEQNEDLAELDVTVRKVAVSLIYLSTECSAVNRDHAPLLKNIKESCVIEKEMPQTSSESYESLVLKQPECSPDEYCISSTAFEATSWNEKNCGVKVRRGRRMKDFRKEILPGLASLSRQEINEDVKIMELVIRSREYGKYKSKSKNNNKVGCFSSVRRRKSRISAVGRKYYS